MRVIFAGTPATALPSLQLLIDSPHEVVAVLTRPDARRGRGRAVGRSAVAVAADEAGIPVLQPQRPREPAFLDELSRWKPDCVPVVAYGALIPQDLLGLPRHGWVNLHFSLLPAWRGAAPVQHAILAGDSVTGATTFRLDAGMDTGPVYGVVTERIRDRDTSGQLLERLSHSGAQLLLATIDGLALGRIEARAQSDEDISYAPKLTPDDLRIDWRTPALRVDRLTRAAAPSPGAWTQLRGERVKVGPVTPVAGSDAAGEQLAAGELRVVDGDVVVGTATSPVRLDQVQAAGKRAMAAADWVRGLRLDQGEGFE